MAGALVGCTPVVVGEEVDAAVHAGGCGVAFAGSVSKKTVLLPQG